MSIRYLLVGAALLGLSACGPSYTEAPTATAYFALLASADIKKSVSVLGMCYERNYNGINWDGTGEWFATVRMADESIYHFRLVNVGSALGDSDKPVELKFMNTPSQREKEAGRPREGCLQDAQPYFIKDRGDGKGLKAYVNEETAINSPFDEGTKAVFKRALQAAESATAAHKNYMPPEKSWGLK